MYDFLRGTLCKVAGDRVVLDVCGVGYAMTVSGWCAASLPEVGATVQLPVADQLRQDAVVLYGFLDEDERAWFHTLQTVQGVGAKVALSMLSTFRPDELVHVLSASDSKTLTKAQGVSAKIAQRIITDLGGTADPQTTGVAEQDSPTTNVREDAVKALVNTGLDRKAARARVDRIMADAPEASLAELIKTAISDETRMAA